MSADTEVSGRLFDRVAKTYTSARPGYPRELYEYLGQNCGLTTGCRVLEIGPGTGQATLDLLERGCVVTAVEPGREMARLLSRRATRPVEIIVDTFEAATVPANAFDLVAAATSFHWVDPEIGIARATDALVDGGWLALWGTGHSDPDRPDGFRQHLESVLERRAPELVKTDPALKPAQPWAAAVAASPDLDEVVEVFFRWERTYDARGLRELFATFSGWLALDDAKREPLLDEVERIVREEFGGAVTRPHRTVLHTARRLSR